MKSLFSFFALFAFAGVISAAPVPEEAPQAVTYPIRRPRIERPHRPNFRHGQQQKPGSSNGFWRVFSQLSPAEQKEMMQLQRTEPEKFRTVMQEKLEKIQAEQREKHRKVLHSKWYGAHLFRSIPSPDILCRVNRALEINIYKLKT